VLPDKKQEKTNPLANSQLFANPAPLPALPTTSPAPRPVAPTPAKPARPKKLDREEAKAEEPALPPLLYKSEPSDEYLGRPFDRQYDKGALNANPYLMGAFDALAKLLKKDKYEIFEELMREFIHQHEHLLEQHEKLVRDKEEKYRKKHNL